MIGQDISLDVLYQHGHAISETWESSDLYCPSCGHRTVWIESGPGDFYEGPNHLCADCGAGFTMPSFHNTVSHEDAQRLEAIHGR